MQILVLLGMYFDAVVVFVTSQTILFRLALAILCGNFVLKVRNDYNFCLFLFSIKTNLFSVFMY